MKIEAIAKVKTRATAMRIADMLSRLYGASDIPLGGPSGLISGARRRDVQAFNLFPVEMDMRRWPAMDCDPLLHDEEDYGFMIDDGEEPAIWPLSVGSVLPCDAGFRLGMCSTPALKDLRGKANIVAKRMVMMQSIDCDVGGRALSSYSICCARVGKTWVDCVGQSRITPDFVNQTHGVMRQPPLYIGMALRHRYEWAAVFHFPTGLRLRFGCSAEGALALFKDREKEGAEARRRALLHWVRRHWRALPEQDLSTEVRKHLRGAGTIDWHGMSVTIVPAAYEVEKAEITVK
jgi:hypothetical protein